MVCGYFGYSRMKNFNPRIYRILTLARLMSVMLFIGKATSVNAGHLKGSELTYSCTGNNQYQIRYTLYTDCQGGAPGQQSPLDVKSSACNQYFSTILYLQSNESDVIDLTCTSATNACNGGSAPAIRKWVYTGTLTLPSACADWKISVSECCRNGLITTVQSPSNAAIYTEALINNESGMNDSPKFAADPTFWLLAGQINRVHPGISGTNGDSLVIRFITPRTSSTETVQYLPGYGADRPFRLNEPLSLHNFTGEFSITPIYQETGIIALSAEEYRNGILVGQVIRETEITVIQNGNRLPSLSGIDGQDFFEMTVCQENQVCFDVFASDEDSTESVSVTINEMPEGAAASVSSGRLPNIHFCWTVEDGKQQDEPYKFQITVRDNHCPLQGVQVYTYLISVKGFEVSETTSPATCSNRSDGGIELHLPMEQSTYEIDWLQSEESSAIRSQLLPGTYEVVITDNVTGCESRRSIQVNFEHEAPFITLGTNQVVCEGREIILDPGTGFSEYKWQDGSTSSQYPVSTTGWYSVDVNDQFGCTGEASVHILMSPCTAVEEPLVAAKMRIYPNPVNAVLQLDFPKALEKTYQLLITDVMGKEILSHSVSKLTTVERIDVSTLLNGVYLLHLYQGDEKATFRFIKE